MSIKKHTFKFGIHPADHKDLTKDIPSKRLPVSENYYISFADHLGKSATPIVTKGDKVKKGQLIAKQNGFVSANVFSPVSGEVVGIVKRKNLLGKPQDHIQIKYEGEEEGYFEPLTTFSKEEILSRIEESGIIGLGGAGFPTHVKLAAKCPIDTLLINAAECEPYLTCDHRLMLEKTEEIAKGISYMAKALGVTNIIFGVEDNKMDVYEAFSDKGFTMKLLKKKYPQGGEKLLIYACTGKKVPHKGGLPMDVGCVVQNPATAFAVYEACALGKPLFERMMTVAGKGFDRPGNIWVKNGTPHNEIYDFCGLNDKALKLISGGPMMGCPIADLMISTTKTESGLLALDKSESDEYDPTNCINCGKCAKACPFNLMPMFIDFYVQAGNLDEAEKYGASECVSCGCCSYVCPAKRPLVSSIKLAKTKLRGRKK